MEIRLTEEEIHRIGHEEFWKYKTNGFILVATDDFLAIARAIERELQPKIRAEIVAAVQCEEIATEWLRDGEQKPMLVPPADPA